MGTYAIIKLKNSNQATEINSLLKEKYNLKYNVYKNVDFGLFHSQEMFNADLDFINNDEEGKKLLTSYNRPISAETYKSILFGAGNCFGDIGSYCVKLNNLTDEDIVKIKVLVKFSRTKDFRKYINIVKSQNFEELIKIKQIN